MWSDIRQRLAKGEQVWGTMSRFVRDPGIANIIKNAGYDFMFVDMEHSVYSFETVADIIRTARAYGIAPIVRPPARQAFYITRLLDAGAVGLMVPMTETKENALEIRDAAKYRPVGKRGCAGMLAQTDFLPCPPDELFSGANDHNLIIAQVESKAGIENIEDIVSTDGIDGVIIGPFDLSDSLGCIGKITSDEVTEAIGTVVEVCKKYDKPSGIHTGNIEQLHYWKERGMQLLGYSTDVNILHNGYVESMKKLRG